MNDWKPIAPHTFESVSRSNEGWSHRTVAIELPGGGHCVFSPTRGMAPGAIVPRFLVATNHYHWLGIPEWSARFPDARIVATKTAAPRLRSKLGREIGALDDVELPSGIRWLEAPGIGSGEIFVDAEGTWIVCDAFFNEPEPGTGVMGFGLRLSGTIPGLRIGQTWKFLQLANRSVYKEWMLARLASAPPSGLIMAHGAPIGGSDLGTRLADLVRERV
jgi:hypothetical protein